MENPFVQLRQFDPEVFDVVVAEEERQKNTINIVASENYASALATSLEGCVFTNKNTEGYINTRVAKGCEYADQIEHIAIERAKKLFGMEHANLQAYSATIANLAVFYGALKPGEAVLAMDLAHGGHLSHGSSIHSTGTFFKTYHYGVSRETELIDYEQVQSLAMEVKPRMIVVGASSYPRFVDFKRFREIADQVGAYLMADIAHWSGLVAAGLFPSPAPYCDFVNMSCQKTLRGPRGCGIMLSKAEHARIINRAIFPGLQGGPKMDMIAARAVLLKEAMSKEFKAYQQQVLANAQVMSEMLKGKGYRLVSDGTDTHLVLIDLQAQNITGHDAANLLETVGIISNRNSIPFDPLGPLVTSGLRIGTPAITTRGMKEAEVKIIVELLHRTLENRTNKAILSKISMEAKELANAYPLFADEWICR